MSLADTELTINGTSFKGVYIAILLSLVTTLGSGIWAASALYNRLVDVEARSIPNVAPMQEEINLIQQQLQDNDVSQLKAKLAELGTNLSTIMEQQAKLLTVSQDITDLEKDIEAMRSTVKTAELVAKDLEGLDDKFKTITKEIDDLWEGMDYLSNPLR